MRKQFDIFEKQLEHVGSSSESWSVLIPSVLVILALLVWWSIAHASVLCHCWTRLFASRLLPQTYPMLKKTLALTMNCLSEVRRNTFNLLLPLYQPPIHTCWSTCLDYGPHYPSLTYRPITNQRLLNVSLNYIAIDIFIITTHSIWWCTL